MKARWRAALPNIVTRVPLGWGPMAGSRRAQGSSLPTAPRWVLTDLGREPFVTPGKLEAGPREAPDFERRAAGSVVAGPHGGTESCSRERSVRGSGTHQSSFLVDPYAWPYNGSRFCCGAPLDSNTDEQNLTAPSAASAG